MRGHIVLLGTQKSHRYLQTPFHSVDIHSEMPGTHIRHFAFGRHLGNIIGVYWSLCILEPCEKTLSYGVRYQFVCWAMDDNATAQLGPKGPLTGDI